MIFVAHSAIGSNQLLIVVSIDASHPDSAAIGIVSKEIMIDPTAFPRWMQ
jgi:hypothetical protein